MRAGGRAAAGRGVRACSGLALPPPGGRCGQRRGHSEGRPWPKSCPGPRLPDRRPAGTAREPRRTAGAVRRPAGSAMFRASRAGRKQETWKREPASPGQRSPPGLSPRGRCGATTPPAAPLRKGPLGSGSAGRAPGGEPLRSAHPLGFGQRSGAPPRHEPGPPGAEEDAVQPRVRGRAPRRAERSSRAEGTKPAAGRRAGREAPRFAATRQRGQREP